MHLDLLYCYKIVFGLVNVNFDDFFALSTNTNTGGHKYELFKTRCTLSVYRSRFEALPSISSAIFAEHTVKRSNNATDNGHIYARGFADDCYGLGCDL